MKKLISMLFLAVLAELSAFAQCTTTNASGCQCETPGSTNCDLLPDIIAARPPLLVSGSSGIIEYSQSGNGSNNGRLRISVSTPNIGHGPLEIRTTNIYICGTDTLTGTPPSTCPNTGLPPRQLIKQRVYHKNGNTMTYYDRDAGSMTFHPTHGHMHVDNWGVFTLRTQTSDPNPLNWPIVGNGAKLAFCLMDYGSCSTYPGHCVDSLGNTLLNGNFPNYGLGGGSYNCSQTVQGISSGYTDIYYQSLDGMYITIPPGTCNGPYQIVVELDPFNYFLEEREDNNVIVVPYTLTQQSGGIAPTITPSGSTTICSGGTVTLTSSAATSYLWSNGATTQSIQVSQSGSYSVTANPGSNCPVSSQPVNVTAYQIPVEATVSDSSICSGESVNLGVSISSPPTTTAQAIFSNNSSYAIPDNNSTGVSSPITVSGINPTTMSNGVVVSARINITHPYVGDLVAYLISPAGTSITLSNRRGGSGDHFTNTVFSMSASTPVGSGSAPFNGSYIPDGNISNFTGNANGTWLLRVVDAAANDIGNITSWTLTLNNVMPAALQYSWSSNPVGFSTNTVSPAVAPTASTQYSVLVTNPTNGCTGTDSVQVEVSPTPLSPYPLNGPALACVGTTLNYHVTNNPNVNSYNWTVPPGASIVSGQGTHSIMVNFSSSYTTGQICVASQKGSCISTPRCKTVTKHTAIQPTPIIGEVNGHCVTTNGTVSVNPVSYAVSYQWTPPSGLTITSGQGTNSIVFSTASGFKSGQLCVTSNNGCMNSTARCATISAAPAKPVISGTSSVCAGQQSVAYTASSSYGATNYKWTGPSGAVIASGQGTTASTIHFGSSAGNVTCVAKNSCGSKGTAFFPISMTCRSMESILPFDANISPNPAFGKTYLNIVKGANKTASVTIVDAIGKTRLQQEIELGLGNEVELDLSSLAAGIYLVEVRADDHNKILRLVVE
jgi:subtilisin-like proprotein convertase family protein